MRIRHRAEAFPAVAAQLVQPAVIPRAGVGVGGDRLVVGERLLGQRRPGDRRRRVAAATAAGFSPASSWASASGSPGNKVGSGPSRSCIGVMPPLCRATTMPPRQTAVGSLSSDRYFDTEEDSCDLCPIHQGLTATTRRTRSIEAPRATRWNPRPTPLSSPAGADENDRGLPRSRSGDRGDRPGRSGTTAADPQLQPVNVASPPRASMPRKPRSSTRPPSPPPRSSQPDRRRAAANRSPRIATPQSDSAPAGSASCGRLVNAAGAGCWR